VPKFGTRAEVRHLPSLDKRSKLDDHRPIIEEETLHHIRVFDWIAGRGDRTNGHSESTWLKVSP
jgi:hypothetical protein